MRKSTKVKRVMDILSGQSESTLVEMFCPDKDAILEDLKSKLETDSFYLDDMYERLIGPEEEGVIKHTITLTFETKKKVSKKVMGEISYAAFVQLEGLTDDFGVKYDNANYFTDSKRGKR